MHLLININGSHENLIGSICNACLLLTKQNKNTQRPERNQNVTFCWHKSGRKKEKASLITYKTETENRNIQTLIQQSVCSHILISSLMKYLYRHIIIHYWQSHWKASLFLVLHSHLSTRPHGLELAREKKSVTSHKQTNKQTKPLVKEKPGQMDKSPILWKDLKLSGANNTIAHLKSL